MSKSEEKLQRLIVRTVQAERINRAFLYSLIACAGLWPLLTGGFPPSLLATASSPIALLIWCLLVVGNAIGSIVALVKKSLIWEAFFVLMCSASIGIYALSMIQAITVNDLLGSGIALFLVGATSLGLLGRAISLFQVIIPELFLLFRSKNEEEEG